MEKLIRMAKDGTTLEVHPSCVADHQRLGWAISPEAPEPDVDETTDNGGSSETASEELRAARADYEAVVGKKPFHGWDVATLRDKIQVAKTGQQ
jgi:hypothetical protein